MSGKKKHEEAAKMKGRYMLHNKSWFDKILQNFTKFYMDVIAAIILLVL